MLKISKNKTTTFKCEVHVETEGKNVKNLKSRLILYPTNDNRNIMFEGIVQDGTCTVDINPDIDINKHGKVILEVIVDDASIFTPWNSLYEIVSDKVVVEATQITYAGNRAKVSINEVNKPDKPARKIKKKEKFNDMLEEAASMIKDNKEVKKDNKLLIHAYTDSIKSLSKEELKAMVDFVKKGYTPKKQSLQWAERVIGENITIKSKLLMYCNELKNKGEIL